MPLAHYHLLQPSGCRQYQYPLVVRSNLLSQLQWARAHDEAAREIASCGASFIDHEMDEHHRWCAMHAAVGAVANQQRGRRVNASIAALETPRDTN